MTQSARIAMAIAMLGGAACARTSAHPASETVLSSAEALAAVRELDDAWRAEDAAIVADMLANNYVYVSSTGDVLSRDWLLEELLGNSTYQLDRSERSELQVSLHGAAAVVSSRWVGEGSYEGEPVRDDQRCTLVVVKDNARTRIAMEHCTNITS